MDARQRAAFEAKVKRFTKSKTATRHIARQTLIDQGIYTAEGDVAAEYSSAEDREDRKPSEQGGR